jgi:hypothetical protein
MMRLRVGWAACSEHYPSFFLGLELRCTRGTNESIAANVLALSPTNLQCDFLTQLQLPILAQLLIGIVISVFMSYLHFSDFFSLAMQAICILYTATSR